MYKWINNPTSCNLNLFDNVSNIINFNFEPFKFQDVLCMMKYVQNFIVFTDMIYTSYKSCLYYWILNFTYGDG